MSTILIAWLIISIIVISSIKVCDWFEESNDFKILLNLYGIICCLPGFIIIAPFYLLFQIGKLVFSTSPAKAFHKFMSTDIRELIKFRIKLEKK